jgi:Resolvase, N terminal domain
MNSRYHFRKPDEMPEEEIRTHGPRALLTTSPLGIYIRQSQMSQAIDHRASRELQSKDFFEHAIKLGWNPDLIETYDDTGLTAVLGINDRERLLDMYEAIKAGRMKTVMIYMIDRLFRDEFLTEATRFGETCAKNGVMLLTYYGQVYDMRNDIDYGNFIMECRWAYHSYKNGILRRMNDLRATVGKRGEYDGRPLAWGYMRNPAIPWKIQVYEPHAQVIREKLFPRFIELDFNQSKFAREFDGVDLFPPVPPDMAKWFHTPKKPEHNGWYRLNRFGLLGVLCNPMYIGWWGYLGNWKQDNHTAILDEETFWTVFSQVSPVDIDGESMSRVKRYEQTKTECPILLRRLLFGEEAGQHVVAYANRKYAEEKIRSWGYKIYDQTAPHKRILLANVKSSVIDRAVAERLLTLLHNEQALADYHTRMEQTVERLEKRKELVKEDLASIEKGLKGALRIMEDGDVDIEAYNEAKRTRKELLAKKQRLEAELSKEHPVTKGEAHATPPDYRDLLIKIREKWDSGIFSIADKRQLLAEFLEKVTICKLSAHFYRLKIYWLVTEVPEEILLWYPYGDSPIWTYEEEEQLQMCYPDKEKLMEALHKRTWSAILHRSFEKGLAASIPREARAAYMELENLLTYEDRQVMVSCGVTLDSLPRGKPVSLLWSKRHDNDISDLSITTNTAFD